MILFVGSEPLAAETTDQTLTPLKLVSPIIGKLWPQGPSGAGGNATGTMLHELVEMCKEEGLYVDTKTAQLEITTHMKALRHVLLAIDHCHAKCRLTVPQQKQWERFTKHVKMGKKGERQMDFKRLRVLLFGGYLEDDPKKKKYITGLPCACGSYNRACCCCCYCCYYYYQEKKEK